MFFGELDDVVCALQVIGDQAGFESQLEETTNFSVEVTRSLPDITWKRSDAVSELQVDLIKQYVVLVHNGETKDDLQRVLTVVDELLGGLI